MKRRRRRVALLAVLIVGVVAVGVASLAEAPSGEPVRTAPVVTMPEGRVRVEILNGGGVAGMAREATTLLRDVGFDVVDFGNAASFDPVRPSEVVDRVGRAEVAQAVADALGIDNVRSDPDPNLYVDVTVLLGKEWSPATRLRAGGDGRGGGPRWDPRGWFGR